MPARRKQGNAVVAGTEDRLIGPGTSPPNSGFLVVNADDWGRDRETTDRTLDAIHCGAVSSVSAMMFMEDAERAAAIAREQAIDAGLHLNLTTPFTTPNVPERLVAEQQRLACVLRKGRLSAVMYHPGLRGAFEYVVTAQLDEFQRLYGAAAQRLDGHHHMHLCANVLFGGLLPAGTLVRRNFSFRAGEKSWSNRLYRRAVDRILARRHRLTDFFFSLKPLQDRQRLERIFSLATTYRVELETHPVVSDEYSFLTGGEIFRWIPAGRIRSFRGLGKPPSVNPGHRAPAGTAGMAQ